MLRADPIAIASLRLDDAPRVATDGQTAETEAGR
jgi:hypothetical protein